MANLPSKIQVLGLYRRILRLSRTWNSVNPLNTEEERKYIQNEARYWFRRNSSVSDPKAISDHLIEGEARLEMGKIQLPRKICTSTDKTVVKALHYRNPYPRPVNLPPKAYTVKQGKKSGHVQEKLKELSRPVYVRSIDHDSGLKSGSSS